MGLGIEQNRYWTDDEVEVMGGEGIHLAIGNLVLSEATVSTTIAEAELDGLGQE